MHLQCVIEPDYPITPPVFGLGIVWKTERIGDTDEHVRVSIILMSQQGPETRSPTPGRGLRCMFGQHMVPGSQPLVLRPSTGAGLSTKSVLLAMVNIIAMISRMLINVGNGIIISQGNFKFWGFPNITDFLLSMYGTLEIRSCLTSVQI